MTFPKIFLVLGFVATILNAKGAVVITEVMSSSSNPGGTNNADWFELTNAGPLAVDLTGWYWDDSDVTTPGNFGSITSIAAGQSIIFTGETVGSVAEAAWAGDWGLAGVTVVNLGSAVFQSFASTGDIINVYNMGGQLQVNVTFSTATMGFSFAWNKGGESLGLSAAGINGAFVAVSNGAGGPGTDVGSPGYAAPVPEPGTVALLAGGLGVLLYGFRRRRSRG